MARLSFVSNAEMFSLLAEFTAPLLLRHLQTDIYIYCS